MKAPKWLNELHWKDLTGSFFYPHGVVRPAGIVGFFMRDADRCCSVSGAAGDLTGSLADRRLAVASTGLLLSVRREFVGSSDGSISLPGLGKPIVSAANPLGRTPIAFTDPVSSNEAVSEYLRSPKVISRAGFHGDP